MKLYKTIYFYIFLFISIPIIGHSQEILNQYLTTAAENNSGLRVKFNQYMAALQKGDQVGTMPDPKIAFGYFILPVETRVGPQQFKISAQQYFPWFGKLKANRNTANEMAKSKYELFEDAKLKLFYDVKSAYYKLYFTSKAIKIIKENLAILETFRKLALIKVEAGMASAVDELRIEMELNDLENDLALLRDKYFTETIEFNNLLNVDNNNTIQIPDSLQSDSLEFTRQSILDSIQSKNHQLISIDFELTSMEQKEIASRKSGAPDFTIGIDYTVVGKSDNPAMDNSGQDILMFPTIGITIPIFRKKYQAMIKEAVIYQDIAKDKKTDKTNLLENMFENVYKDYQDAERREKLYLKQAKTANRAMRLLQSEYATNSSNFEEMLRMERRLLRYELELEKATIDKNTAIAFILYLMGK
ncbi:MAG: TolC family protein [Bacteroidales bacterium]|nr:TolC family protein [Bacteroidales bacterium]